MKREDTITHALHANGTYAEVYVRSYKTKTGKERIRMRNYRRKIQRTITDPDAIKVLNRVWNLKIVK